MAAGSGGELLVADTYNSLLRVWRGAHLWTVPIEGLREPGGVCVEPGGTIVVADTAGHRLVRGDLEAGAAAEVLDLAEAVVAAPGDVLEVLLDVPLGGDDLDGGGGPAIQVHAVATAPGLIAGDVAWTFRGLPARVEIELGEGAGRIGVQLRAATCGPDACRVRMAARQFDVIVEEAGHA